MAKFRKKPVVIEAIQFDGLNVQEVVKFTDGLAKPVPMSMVVFAALDISTLEGTMRADLDDWIIKGVHGEFYPCKPDIFAATYEPVKEVSA